MTYKQLLQKLKNLNDEQLNMDVTVYQSEYDEYFPANDFFINENSNVLDIKHPYITLD